MHSWLGRRLWRWHAARRGVLVEHLDEGSGPIIEILAAEDFALFGKELSRRARQLLATLHAFRIIGGFDNPPPARAEPSDDLARSEVEEVMRQEPCRIGVILELAQDFSGLYGFPGSAPASASAWIVQMRSSYAATYMGVMPLVRGAFTSAPSLTSSFTASVWPCWAAT